MAVALLGLVTPGLAQPYAASGGFDRARQLDRAGGVPSGAVAIDGDSAYAYWDDGAGIVRRSLDDETAPPERVVEAPSVRRVLAASFDGEPALAWVQRSRDTGRSDYLLRWRDETRLVQSAPLQNPLALAVGPAGPLLLLVARDSGEAHLDLHRWDGGVVRVHSSDRDLASPSLLFDDAGGVVVAWLEGETIRTEFGVEAEWEAFAAYVFDDGTAGDANPLGVAAHDGVQFVTRIDWPESGPQVAWTAPGGRLLLARPGEPPLQIGTGHPIGVFGDDFYWSDETSIRRRPIGADDAPGDNVVWSPTEPERIAGIEHDGHIHLVWYGAAIGGGFTVYTADDRTPIVLGWRDHLAARMGWRPWDFWQALAGQALVSVLIGLLATMAMLPLLLLAATVLSRLVAPRRSTTTGLAVGVAGLLVLVALTAWLAARPGFPADVRSLFGTWELAVAIAVGVGVGWLLRRGSDSETAFEIVASAGISTLVMLALLGFLHYPAWTRLWGGAL